MHILVVLNHVRDLEPKQTSTLLIQACLEAGHQITVSGIEDVQHLDGSLAGTGVTFVKPFSTPSDLCLTLKSAAVSPWKRPEFVMLRTNPGRDDRPLAVHLQKLRMLCDVSTVFLNQPQALIAGIGKTNLLWLDPTHIPQTWITSRWEDVREAFANLQHGAVVKPLHGTRGEGIFRIPPGDQKTLSAAMQTTAEPMVQEFLPEVERGDLRVVVMRGKVLAVDGQPAAIRRKPQAGDFRSNLHQGGTAHATELSDELHKIATHSAEILNQRGIALAGLDFVGNKIIEINIFATGGLKPARDLYGKDFCAAIISLL